MSKPVLAPYKLLSILLYSDEDFIDREYPMVVVGSDGLNKNHRIDPRSCQNYLLYLYDRKLISDFKWFKHYFTAVLNTPIGFDRMDDAA